MLEWCCSASWLAIRADATGLSWCPEIPQEALLCHGLCFAKAYQAELWEECDACPSLELHLDLAISCWVLHLTWIQMLLEQTISFLFSTTFH